MYEAMNHPAFLSCVFSQHSGEYVNTSNDDDECDSAHIFSAG